MGRFPYVYSGTMLVSLNGASQGLIDLGADTRWRKIVPQASLKTNAGYSVLLQPTKGSAAEVYLSGTSDVKWASAYAAATATAAFANQPTDGDTLEILSSVATDTTQTITIYASTASGGAIKAYKARLMGTTVVGMGSTAPYDRQGSAGSGGFYNVHGIELSAVTTGNITVREASGNQTIKAITAGTLSVGVTNIAVASQNAFGLPVYFDVSTGTKVAGIWGEPVVDDGSEGEEVVTTTAGIYTKRCFSKVKKLLWGDLANATTITIGQLGLTLTNGGAIELTDKGADELFDLNHRYLAWAVYSTATLSNGGASDALRIALYG